MTHPRRLQIASFSTDLGWMAMVATERQVKQIVFGYPSAAAALAALEGDLDDADMAGDAWQWLVQRLQDFAAGQKVDFSDVALDLAHLTAFQRRIVKHCRAIPYGQTRSYGDLAALAGSPRAARAVGNTMATNRYALVVPCHRVVNSDGSPGRYGGPGGAQLKRQLLALEGQRRRRQTAPRRAGRQRSKALLGP